jgi:hypothetical protein
LLSAADADARACLCADEAQVLVLHALAQPALPHDHPAFPERGLVTIDVSARCRGGSHTYRGVLYGYAAPPPGSDQVKSTKSLDARC